MVSVRIDYSDACFFVVPFYQIAVHGLICYQGVWVHHYRQRPGGVKRGLLQELAFGARPSMEISYTGKCVDSYLNSIRDLKDAYKRSFSELKGLHIETIEEFEELEPDAAYRTVYSDGTEIAVNFGDRSVCGLAPLSCRIKRK